MAHFATIPPIYPLLYAWPGLLLVGAIYMVTLLALIVPHFLGRRR
jgi:hypothetical protein